MNKRHSAILILTLILLITAGCRVDGPLRSQLDEADSLMEARPDSALALLDGIYGRIAICF